MDIVAYAVSEQVTPISLETGISVETGQLQPVYPLWRANPTVEKLPSLNGAKLMLLMVLLPQIWGPIDRR